MIVVMDLTRLNQCARTLNVILRKSSNVKTNDVFHCGKSVTVSMNVATDPTKTIIHCVESGHYLACPINSNVQMIDVSIWEKFATITTIVVIFPMNAVAIKATVR